MKKKIFLTGATGVFGSETLKRLLERTDIFEVTTLVRPSSKNKKFMSGFRQDGLRIIWGDLLDADAVAQGVADAEIVLHIGGIVSPKADYMPELTMKTNIGSIKNIVSAVKKKRNPDETAVVSIGSVSQYGPRKTPLHWCRCGDPMISAENDYYAISKIIAERILAESGLKRWVSLRQSGILYPELLLKGTEPISFHVPLNGMIEWTTREQSGRLLANLCESDIPDDFWRRFYNIGGGESFRLTNYDFEAKLMRSLNCPPPEKVFEPNWFATRNFHGAWFADSDLLENLFHFRGEMKAESYFKYMSDSSPKIFKLAGIVPPSLIKLGMKWVANKEGFGPLNWIKNDNEQLIYSYFKSKDDWAKIPGWDKFPLEHPSVSQSSAQLLNHGYDETKPLEELTIEDMKEAAAFRGGKCLSEDMKKGELWEKLRWECAEGHQFEAYPGTILLGGHWCEQCLPPKWRYNKQSKKNIFLAQAWYNTHDRDEKDFD